MYPGTILKAPYALPPLLPPSLPLPCHIRSSYTISLTCQKQWRDHQEKSGRCSEWKKFGIKIERKEKSWLLVVVWLPLWKSKFHSDRCICRYVKTWKNLCLCVIGKWILQFKLLPILSDSTWTASDVIATFSQYQRNRCTKNINFSKMTVRRSFIFKKVQKWYSTLFGVLQMLVTEISHRKSATILEKTND